MGAKPEEKKSPYLLAVERVLARLNDSGLPWPAKPKDYGEEYSFPTDPTTLNYQALGQLQARLAGWHGYAVRVLALADVDHDILDGRFNIALGMKMSALEKASGKRGLKDTLRAEALAAEATLSNAAYGLVEKAAYVKAMKAQASIFDQQAKALSREQSRRSDEIRLKHGTGG